MILKKECSFFLHKKGSVFFEEKEVLWSVKLLSLEVRDKICLFNTQVEKYPVEWYTNSAHETGRVLEKHFVMII